MKLALSLLAIACILCVNVRADQADDLIATLTESDRASVYTALADANLTHKVGQPYAVIMRTLDGQVEYTFTEKEYTKLKDWYNGDYVAPIGEEQTTDKTLSAWEMTNQWKSEHGYDFPIYGSTTADLSPISDYLTLLSDNGIYFALPDLTISHDHEEYEWIYATFSDSDFWFRYKPYNDGSRYSLAIQLPVSYRPHYEALVLLIASTLDVDYQEAESLLNSLQYNVIDHSSEIETEDCVLTYYEYLDMGGFLALTVAKYA